MTLDHKKRIVAIIASLAFLGSILLANWVTTDFGFVPVGFGLTATAGTYLAGLMFVLRDAVHDALGKAWTIGVILAAAVVSFAISAPEIALASGVAFLVAEIGDLAVYSPLRTRGYIRAAVASNIVGSLLDTVLFLSIAGFPVLLAMPGQIVGKLWITLAVVVGVAAFRARRLVTA